MKREMDPIRYTPSFSNGMDIRVIPIHSKHIQQFEHGFATPILIKSYPKRYNTFMDCTST